MRKARYAKERLARETEDRHTEIPVLRSLGGLLIRQERWPEAREHLSVALTLIGNQEMKSIACSVRTLFGLLEARTGQFEAAREHYERSGEMMDSLPTASYKASVFAYRGQIAFLMGEPLAAQTLLEAAEALGPFPSASPHSDLAISLHTLKEQLAQG